MLPGERASVLQAGEHDLPGELLGPLGLSLHVVVVEDERVQVAVAGVEDVRDPQAVLAAEVGDLLQYLPELRARDDGVLHVVVVGDASHRPKGRLAALPEERPLFVVLGDPDLRGVRLLADVDDAIELVRHLGLGTVQLHDQDRARLREARVHRDLDRLDGEGVHHLDRRRDDPLADDPRDGAARLLSVLERRQKRPHRLRLTDYTQRYLGRYPQRPLRAHERPDQVVSRRVGGLPAAAVRHRAVGQNHLRPHDVVRRETVFQTMYAARVLRQVPADGGDDLARRVRGVVVAFVGDLLRDPHVDHTGLDDHPLVRDVHLEDLAHPRHDDEHPRLDRERPAGEAGAGAAGDERDALVVTRFHYPLHMLGGLRQNYEVRDNAVVHQAVALVGAELLALGDHPLLPEYGFHHPYELVPLHVRLLPRLAPESQYKGQDGRVFPVTLPPTILSQSRTRSRRTSHRTGVDLAIEVVRNFVSRPQ